MVAIQDFNKYYNMKALHKDDRMDLNNVSMISLNMPTCRCRRLNKIEMELACLQVERKSIIFWMVGVPCMLMEMLVDRPFFCRYLQLC